MDLRKPIYTRDRGRTQGPFTVAELQLQTRRGKFARHFQVSNDQTQWFGAADFPELFPSVTQYKGRRPLPTPDAKATETDLVEFVEEDVSGSASENGQSAADLSALDQGPLAAVSAAAAGGPQEEALWYYTLGDNQFGPVAFSRVQALAAGGQILPQDCLWTEGMADWIEAGRVAGVFGQSTQSRGASGEMDTKPVNVCPMAIASFVTGLLGTSLIFFLGSIAAVVFGHIALKQITASQNTLAGRGMAIAGLTLGYLVIIATTVIGLVALVMSIMLGATGRPT